MPCWLGLLLLLLRAHLLVSQSEGCEVLVGVDYLLILLFPTLLLLSLCAFLPQVSQFKGCHMLLNICTAALFHLCACLLHRCLVAVFHFAGVSV
jgi:hypothetical protein